MKGRWFITPHAIDAYRKRVKVCSYDEALSDLIKISEEAHYVRDAKQKAQQWRGPKWCRIRLIVGPGKTLPALITVLPVHDGFEMPVCDVGSTNDKLNLIVKRIRERNRDKEWKKERRKIQRELRKYLKTDRSLVPECQAPKSFCPTCYDLPHRRTKPKCKGCGERWEPACTVSVEYVLAQPRENLDELI